jgi:hypothetical protein
MFGDAGDIDESAAVTSRSPAIIVQLLATITEFSSSCGTRQLPDVSKHAFTGIAIGDVGEFALERRSY